jgi:hypothetical protein
VFTLRSSDHPVLLSSLLFLRNSSNATRKWTVGSSNGAWGFTQWTNSSDDCTDTFYLGTVGSSDGVFSFSFLLGFDPRKIEYLLILACGILVSLGPRNVYNDMLNNMVSLIDHVVMNHQNQTRTNGIWGHVRYTGYSDWFQLNNKVILHKPLVLPAIDSVNTLHDTLSHTEQPKEKVCQPSIKVNLHMYVALYPSAKN